MLFLASIYFIFFVNRDPNLKKAGIIGSVLFFIIYICKISASANRFEKKYNEIQRLILKDDEGRNVKVWELENKTSLLVGKKSRDNDVDIELAADSIVGSAFGFSGQKCSACSRAIIHQDVYDEVVKRVIEKTEKLTVGDPRDFGNYMGPVIDEAAFKRLNEYIEIGSKEGKIVAGGKTDGSKGWFVEPTVIVDVKPDARIMQEEIFGPLVAICKVKDFDEALEVANNTEYGLTGSVISRNRMNLEKAREDFHVGNLYFNRKCTGAIVGYQPFGGFNMSGTDSKAGGPDYLILHMQGKSICEQF